MNKLSELSKPVAEVVSKFGDPEAFGEREVKLLIGIQQMAYGTKFYSQEYVSALLQQITELERELNVAASSFSNERARADKLFERLATPVRLPPVQHREFLGLKIDSMDAEQVRISIRAAGFTVEDKQ
ncbi:hypothetical protein [Serratia ficaria]|uniref:hypothetical protein n=1 Tax=Serratia ficaria TaxID=61651 RepID=UPI00217BA3DF|nr:hypothetical protein [Serratia ficaria]CAI1019422.1 Uncharacterised protein [Serratia ficaria]CAI1975067.1 Uncharacterised protein [Serratia ficaria]